jgi:hypothetical protein
MSLRAAIATFIAHSGDRTEMLIPCWATTYNVSVEAVRLEYERQMSIASLKPNNAYDESGEGK